MILFGLQTQIFIGKADDYHDLCLQICLTRYETYLMYHHKFYRVHRHQKQYHLVEKCHLTCIKLLN